MCRRAEQEGCARIATCVGALSLAQSFQRERHHSLSDRGIGDDNVSAVMDNYSLRRPNCSGSESLSDAQSALSTASFVTRSAFLIRCDFAIAPNSPRRSLRLCEPELPPRLAMLKDWGTAHAIAASDVDAFTERALALLVTLNEGSAGRYRLRPSEFRDWKEKFQPSKPAVRSAAGS